MGVVFSAADDVAELLVPFVRSRGGVQDASAIEEAYVAASLGDIHADAFWTRVGLSPDVEADYLRLHTLNPGTLEFLTRARESRVPIWCLSNDVGRWSKQLRASLGIEPFLTGAVISSDARARKPDRKIYERLLEAAGYRPHEILFVDDRARNVDAAIALGMRAVQFTSSYGYAELETELARS